MTGLPIRAEQDDGTFVAKDITECSDDELKRFVESRREDDYGWQWVVALARWIRDHVREDCQNAPTQNAASDLPTLPENQG